ncbi:MAG: transcriptional regulator [Pelodictyon phaeoclathratiforme]
MLNPDNFAHYPKNPVIGAFFREIDRADELGSGMRKMMMYGKKYGGADPQLIEGDVFRMIISVPEFGEKPSNILGREPAAVSSGPESGPESIFKRVIKELLIGARSKSELATALGQKSVSGKLNERIREMLADGLIAQTIPDKPTSRLQKYRLTEKGRNFLRKDETGTC